MNGDEGFTLTDWAIIAAFFGILVPLSLHWNRIKGRVAKARARKRIDDRRLW